MGGTKWTNVLHSMKMLRIMINGDQLTVNNYSMILFNIPNLTKIKKR